MDLYKYMCFILLTTVCYIDAAFILTENDYTWSEATQVCTLATPNLTFSANDITPYLVDQPSADAWLGYIEKMTPFEYFGCAKTTEAGEYTVKYVTEGDPGKCWSACNNVNNVKAVAVHGNECYCLHAVNANANKLLHGECDIGCSSQPNIACGSAANSMNDNQNYVSLYKTTYTGSIEASNSKSSLCLLFNKELRTFIWGNCSDHYEIICYNGNTVTLLVDKDDWITMTIKCFSNKQVPSNYTNSDKVVTTEQVNMWTGIIRNGVIYPITDSTNMIEEKYGYVNFSTGHLSFINDSTVRKRAYCVEGTVKNETTSSAVETTTSTGKNATSTVITTNGTVKTTTSTIETSTSTVSQKSSSSNNEQIDTSSHATYNESEGTTGTTDENTNGNGEMLKNGSSDVGAIVGATVAIIIVIIVVIVLVVLWKRGIKFPLEKARKSEKEKTQATNMTHSFARPDNTIQSTDESSFTNYAEVDVSKMTLDGEVTQNGDTNWTSCSSDEPHTYFVLEKVDQGPYDTTKTTRQIHDQHTLNPYNKVSLEESSNYDHIGAHDNDSKTLGLDNPYNTTTLASSSTYNGFTKQNAFNRNNESDDTYNHIEDQSRHTERNNSDNHYNTTTLGHSKNDHGVINIAFNINDECDDTYNHIGDQSGQNNQTITDNPYNTTTLGNSQTNGVNNCTFNNNNDGEDTYNHINGQVPITKPTFTDNDYATLK